MPIFKQYGLRSDCSLANSEDPDEMPQNVSFPQGLHCLPSL